MAGEGKAKAARKKRKKITKKGRVIALHRRHPDWTRRQIAEKLGCSLGTVQLAFQGAGVKQAENKAAHRKKKVEEIITKAAEREVDNTSSAEVLFMRKMLGLWRFNMALFVERALGINGQHGYTISRQQREACDAVSRLVRTKEWRGMGYKLSPEDLEYSKKIGISIMSGQGPGKDAWLSWFMIWFLFCFPNVLIPCTARGHAQLKNILWSEVGRWLNKQDIEGNYLVVQDIREAIVVQGDKIFMKALGGNKNFAFPKTANPKDSPEAQAGTLYGYHDDYMAIIIDEAAHVLDPVFKPLEGTLTKPVNFILLAFNPVKRTGFAIESQRGEFSDKWVKLHWDAEESELVTKDHIEYMAGRHGRNSNTFRTLVKGLPPIAEEGALIPDDWVWAAVERELTPADDDPMIGGLDVGGGGDNSILTIRHGLRVIKQEKFSSPNTDDVTSWACKKYEEYELDALGIDNIGIGSGVYGRMKNLGYRVRSVDARRKARNEERFDNIRAELWWTAREIFEAGTIQIPKDQDLMEELWCPHFDREGKKIKVELKSVMRKRLDKSRSPNNADSLLISLYLKDDMFRRIKGMPQHIHHGITANMVPQEYGWMAA